MKILDVLRDKRSECLSVMTSMTLSEYKEIASCSFEKGGNIDGDRSRRGFGDGNQIENFILCQPTVYERFLPYERNHTITAAKRQDPDLEKGEKQLQINHLCRFLLFSFNQTMR